MRFLRTAVSLILFGAVGMVGREAFAADLLHPYHARHAHHRIVRHAYAPVAYDQCPASEPADYKPRITNFNEPSCYAARPYGMSSTLYDHSMDIDYRAHY